MTTGEALWLLAPAALLYLLGRLGIVKLLLRVVIATLGSYAIALLLVLLAGGALWATGG